MLFRKLFLIICVASNLFYSPAYAGQERILKFWSDIRVHPDSSLTVQETIIVEATGQNIKRGIYRDFPTKRTLGEGKYINVGFKVLDIKRDGKSEPYHIENNGNNKRIYIGQKDIFLSPGIYTYTIIYETTKQIGFFDDFDELYWNATGNEWDFPIEYAAARVTLPQGVQINESIAYTGHTGGKGSDYKIDKDKDGNVVFYTTRELSEKEGITIAVSWPKGFVNPPASNTNNKGIKFALICFGVLILYYFYAWYNVGRDPKKGAIIPLFSPPVGFSPAAINYILHMGFGGGGLNTAFAASLVNMAVKKNIKILDSKGDFSLERISEDQSQLSSGEKLISKKLFSKNNVMVLEQSNHLVLRGVLNTFKETIHQEFNKLYFINNAKYIVPGILITVLFIASLIYSSEDKPTVGFMLVWLSFWTMGITIVAATILQKWKKVFSGTLTSLPGAIFLTLFAIPFFGAEIMVGALFAESIEGGMLSVIFLLGMLLTNGLFYYLLKAPTAKGRQIMDQIEGFKMYLSVVEKDRYEMLHPPAMTPEIFEKYLPYAIALGVENKWSKTFANTVSSSIADNYSPGWYNGSGGRVNTSSLSSSLGSSLVNSISTSSAAPGSSGGGSSGGGGGGGGGGGW